MIYLLLLNSVLNPAAAAQKPRVVITLDKLIISNTETNILTASNLISDQCEQGQPETTGTQTQIGATPGSDKSREDPASEENLPAACTCCEVSLAPCAGNSAIISYVNSFIGFQP